MRAAPHSLLLLPFALSLVLVLACDRVATIRVLDARPSRDASGFVVTDVELEAAEQGGGNVGQYCVSVHWFNTGFNPQTPESSFYPGELDSTQACDDDLEDGDQRTWRLVSQRADLPAGAPARVQVHWGRLFNVKEGVFAP